MDSIVDQLIKNTWRTTNFEDDHLTREWGTMYVYLLYALFLYKEGDHCSVIFKPAEDLIKTNITFLSDVT